MNRLDDFERFFVNVGAVKMEGGKNFFLNRKIPFIASEFGPWMIRKRRGDPLEFLKTFKNARYKI